MKDERIAKLKAENQRIIAEKAEVERKLAALQAKEVAERRKHAMNDETRKALNFIFDCARELVPIQEIARHLGCSVKAAKRELDKLCDAGLVRPIAVPVEQGLKTTDVICYRITSDGRIYIKSIT